MKKINNNKGSTLVMLLIVLTILTMLGTVIMSIAIYNYKIRVANSKIKRNFYFSESGIDEAYGIMGDVVDEAIVQGNDDAESFMNWLNDNIEAIKTNMENEIEDPNAIYLNEDGSLNMEQVVITQNQKFKQGYRNYLISGNRLVSEISNINNYKISYEGIKPQVAIEPANLTFGDDNRLKFKVTSTFKHEDIERQVVAKYEILVPEYNTPYYTESFVQEINKNVAWSKAIAVEGDMKIYGGEVEIDGSVYVKGKEDDFGGISTMSSNTELIIKGNVATQKNIQTASSNSRLQIDGNAYGRNVLIRNKDSNNIDVENSTIRVNTTDTFAGESGTVYTFDDLSLNGEKSQIYISNSYYGISNGFGYSEAGNSSGIVINAEDLGEGSTLTVRNEVFIPGTSYIDVYYNGNKYQTGESVSIKGNYKAYSHPLTEGNPTTLEGESLKEDNVEFEYYRPLLLAHKLINRDRSLTAMEKSEYFKYYKYEMDSLGLDSDLNLGGRGGINIDPSKAKHLGVLIYNNQIQPSNYVIEDFQEQINNGLSKYIRMANFMGVESSKVADVGLNVQGEERTVDYWVRFSNLPSGSQNPVVGDERELVILNGRSRDYAIIGPNGDESKLPSTINKVYLGTNDVVRGLIVTEGNVYFCGTINYRGTVISNGDVYFMDNNAKSIVYDEDTVAKLIAQEENYSILKNVFYDNYDSVLEITTNANIQSSDVGTDIVRDKLIELKAWNTVR